MLIEEVYKNALVVSSGCKLTTVNEFTDQLPALRPEVLIEVAYGMIKKIDCDFDKVVTEEDKGAPIATAISMLTGRPLAMARWYPYRINNINNNIVKINSEYFDGEMYLNGINEGDRVIIVDDTLSTGGAVVSLIKAIESAGGIVSKVICAVEKIQNNGRKNVRDKTGHDVITLLKKSLSAESVTVME
ncbi:adenine phosphoribosyltransferase [Erwinia sp. E602]|uniref:phosphoribosyltransferase family protein n=1 Tax=Erwinia sp. E602 TaxID=2675378 RepID=UPI001BA67131|nr:phosphoribosyltransferase family protein [Erwinia sp. E602]QUG76764.1 adenine phosphoribosyltransferase [Erwinia sp. E602]